MWAITETIAAEPGLTRFDLANRYHLSERQVQADLNLIRSEMRLPLIRRNGYRFTDEGTPSGDGALTLHDAQIMVMVLRQGLRDRTLPDGRVRKLMAKVPGMFPPHLQPLLALMIDAVSRRPDPEQVMFTSLADAILRGSWVKLSYPPGHWPSPGMSEPIVKPELLIPHLNNWYVVAEIAGRNWSRMFKLDDLAAVTIAAEPVANGRS